MYAGKDVDKARSRSNVYGLTKPYVDHQGRIWRTSAHVTARKEMQRMAAHRIHQRRDGQPVQRRGLAAGGGMGRNLPVPPMPPRPSLMVMGSD